MSVQTLYTAATGMQSLETKLDVIAHNLANVNTIAFKRDRVNFEDLFYRYHKLPGAQDSSSQLTPVGIHVGLGSRVESTQVDHSQGASRRTDRPLDLTIEGDGFFQVFDPYRQQNVYTRAGNFSINANGDLVIGSAQSGRLLEPRISIPQDVVESNIIVSPEGLIQVRDSNNPNVLQTVGQLQLSNFRNPEGLLKLGENLYAETPASGAPNLGDPGTPGLALGVLRQGYQESSNVHPVEELIDLITTQRSFELNSQAVQAGDQILQLIANLRRF